ncbi:hypothetical protein PR048_004734 [Dryococelus australis]|uniref:Uncharacterized protein n=1 Tax=Dryococelus australis TaxID=614101 RepID=A0ABQ9I694_9NEOP|nr:hypothetical protein PR048_004734 [Dryococelus australis]
MELTGEIYATVPKCKEFTFCIATTLKNKLINNLRNTDYLTICCNGSTNVNFVMFINQDTSAVTFKYLKITDLPNSSAAAIFNGLKKMLTEQIHSVSPELKKLCPWLLAIQCFELSEVHEFYSKKPLPHHQFQELTKVLGEENVTLVPTSRVQGVRWVSRKKKCLDADA